MSVELDVFVVNTTIMDEEVYQLWLDGYTVNGAVKVRMEGGVWEGCEASAEVLHSDTMDQYRTFQMCERLLHSPVKLANQLLFQIPPHRQAMLIERYYAFDSVFVREVLGKKLSKGTKKDLDDVSAKTGVTLKSCRRQFDNFKRVFKVVEELKGPLVENIRQHFFLSDKLARDYAAIVFFANNRFETGKKKLHYLTFQDFAFCAGQLISNWTVGALDNMVEDMDVDLEKEFLQDLKELKILITDRDLLDQHKSLVCTALRGKTKAFNEMEANFKNLSRGLVNIAAKLTNTKEVRDFFIDLVEKFIEPCRSDKWTAGDMRLYLTHYTNSAHVLDTFNCSSCRSPHSLSQGHRGRSRTDRRTTSALHAHNTPGTNTTSGLEQHIEHRATGTQTRDLKIARRRRFHTGKKTCLATVRQCERNLPSQEFSGITCKKFWPLGGRFSAARGAEHNLSPPGHHVRERADPCATEQNGTKLATYSMHISRQDHLWLALPPIPLSCSEHHNKSEASFILT
ncbi:acidic fibroblast growth factor intracellular-binding protein B-like isoform 2-T2 [Salvelinus alpinus]